MKNQYFGDIGDYGKYGLLRFLAEQGLPVAVNWYLTPDDGRTDGKYTGYLAKDAFRRYSPAIYDTLRQYVSVRKRRDIAVVEETGLIPGARYYAAPLVFPAGMDAAARRRSRAQWHQNALSFCAGAGLVFLDPDNGLRAGEPSSPAMGNKYVYLQELADYYLAGHNVAYYCHRGRRTDEQWTAYKRLLKTVIPSADMTALTFHRGTQRSYIFALQKETAGTIRQMLGAFLASDWKDMFTPEDV